MENFKRCENLLYSIRTLLERYTAEEAKAAILDPLDKVPVLPEVPIPQINLKFPEHEKKEKKAEPFVYEELKN